MKKLILFLILPAFFFSCRKDTPQADITPDKMDELVVPDSFNWKTTKSLQLEVTGHTSGIVVVANMGGIAYQKAYLTANLPYTMNLTLPSYEQKIRLILADKDVTLDLTGGNLTYRFQ
ncbi:MAG TPA: hypothetical protein PK939_10450 [Bacteroidales bacterium]|nr:hypothetical protein [Bacteroidales bacterium]